MQKSEEYYVNEIKVNDWLVDNLENKKSIIKFSNRIEYYLGESLHNEEGASVVWNDKNLNDEYYLHGKKYKDKQTWYVDAIKMLRAKKIKECFS